MPQENPFRLQESPTPDNPFRVVTPLDATEETLQDAVQADVSDAALQVGVAPSTGEVVSEQAAAATPVAFAGAQRPRVQNDDGSQSSELSITVPDPRAPGMWINIPSMFGGQQVSEDAALDVISRAGFADPETGREIQSFSSVEEAVAAAQARSDSLQTAAFAGSPVAGQQLALALEDADVPELELADDATVTETLEDTFLRGPASGAVGAVDAAGDLIGLGADALGIPSIIQLDDRTGLEVLQGAPGGPEFLTNAEAEERGLTELEIFNRMKNALEPQTLGGSITAGLTQVIASLVGGGALVGGFRAASGAVSGTRTVAATTLADFVGFSGGDLGISSLLADNLGLQNAAIRYLADRSEGDTAQNRFSNAVEGFGLGLFGMAIIRAFRYFKGARNAGSRGGTPQESQRNIEEYYDENRMELQGIADDLNEVQSSQEFASAVSRAPTGSPGATASAELADPERLGEIATDAAVRRLGLGIPDNFSATRPTVNSAGLQDALMRLDINPNFVDEFAGPSPFNHGRMNGPAEIDRAVRVAAQVVRPQIDELVQSGTKTFEQIRNEQVEILADVTGLGYDTLIARLARRAEGIDQQAAEMTAARSATQSIAREAVLLSRKVTNGQGTDLDRAKLLLVSQQWGDLTANLRAITTGTARAQASGRIVTGADFTDVNVNNAFLQDALARGDVDILASQIASMDGNIKGIGAVLKNPPSRLRKFTEFYINALLSNPKTHLLNFFSNTAQTVWLPAEKIVGGTLTGRGSDVREGMLQYYYMKEAMQESGQAIGKAFRTGQGVLDTVGKLDEVYSKIAITSDSDTIYGSAMRGFGTMVRMPTRLLTTGDEVFKQINYRSALKARANIEARELFGDDIVARNDYIQKRVTDGFDPKTGQALDQEALDYARTATFTTPLEEGQAYVDIARGLQGFVRIVPPARFASPFIRTPANLIRQSIMRTPGLGFIQKQLVDDMLAGGTRRSTAVGKQVLGLGVTVSAMFGAANGRITGGGPADPAQLGRLRATGWRPYSYVTTNSAGEREYTEYGRFDPFAQVVGMAADLYLLAPTSSEAEMDEAAMALGIAFARNISQKSYLTGTVAAMEAWTQPDEKFTQWVGTIASGFVPSGARPIADALGITDDPVIREARTVIDRLKAKTPGLSSTLPPKRDWLNGQPAMYPQGYIWGNNSLAPFPRSTRNEDLVLNELANIPHGFTAPPRQMLGVDLTEQEHDRWEELHGTIEISGRTLVQALEGAMQSDSYDLDRSRGVPDVPGDPDANRRVQIIAPIIQGYRKAAAAQLREESHRDTPEGEESLQDRVENLMRLRGGLLEGRSSTPAILEELRRALDSDGTNARFN